MPQFHIEIRTDTHVRKTIHVERDNYRAPRTEVARFVGELLRDHSDQIWVDEDWRVDVTDDRGLILYVMHISAVETAATMSQPLPGM